MTRQEPAFGVSDSETRTSETGYDESHPALRRRCKVCGAQVGKPCGIESDDSFFVHIGRRGFWYRLGVASEQAARDANDLAGY